VSSRIRDGKRNHVKRANGKNISNNIVFLMTRREETRGSKGKLERMRHIGQLIIILLVYIYIVYSHGSSDANCRIRSFEGRARYRIGASGGMTKVN